MTSPAGLRDLREGLHASFSRRADALFELCEAMLVAGTVPSPPHLSLVPVHRRGWCSLYGALRRGVIEEGAVRDLLVRCSSRLGAEDRPASYAVEVDAHTASSVGMLVT